MFIKTFGLEVTFLTKNKMNQYLLIGIVLYIISSVMLHSNSSITQKSSNKNHLINKAEALVNLLRVLSSYLMVIVIIMVI